MEFIWNSPIKASLNVDIETAFRESLMQLIAIILTIFFRKLT